MIRIVSTYLLLCLTAAVSYSFPGQLLGISRGTSSAPPVFAIFDTFTRTEDPLASGWTGPIINAEQCEADGDEIVRDLDGPTNCGSYYSTSQCPDDCRIELTIGAGAGGTTLVCMLTDIGGGGDGYCVRMTSSATTIRRADNGALTQISTVSATWSNGERLGIRKTGTTLASYQDDTELDTQVDATYSGPWFVAVLIESTFRGSEIGANLQ